MNISKFYDEINEHFFLFGETKNDFEEFEKNKNYNGFAVIKKNN